MLVQKKIKTSSVLNRNSAILRVQNQRENPNEMRILRLGWSLSA